MSGLVLVTGGAGFVGSAVVDDLVADGWRVRVLDSLAPGAHSTEPSYLNDDAEYRWGEIADEALLARAVEGVDAVSHQAAMVGLGVDFSDVADYVRANSLGTAQLLRALHRRRFGGRLVLASSMVVYGEGRYACPEHGAVAAPPRALRDLSRGRFEPRCPDCGRDLVAEPVEESTPADPRNVYAATKLNQEHLCAAYARESGCSVAALRYHNVYGPRMPRDTPYSGVAAIFRAAAENGEAARVFEDGRQRRDFVNVADVAACNRLALASSAEGAFNVASGEPRTVGEMAAALASAIGGAEPVVTGEFRRGDVRHVFASMGRAASELGYRPAVRFEAGMREFATAPLRDPVR